MEPVSPSSPDSTPAVPRLLVLMRHGKAEAFAEEDHQRRLTDRGARDATAAGQWLAARGLVPTHAFVSTSARTRGTWAALAAGAGATIEPDFDDAVYAADPDSALDVLRTAPADADVLLLLGHNPTVATLAHVLDDGAPEADAFRAMSEGFPTSALAVLEVEVPWADLDAGTAHLVGFHAG
jgi:phosphohistidine phosphatase